LLNPPHPLSVFMNPIQRFRAVWRARAFAQDRAALDARWKDLQREAHPDQFAAQGARPSAVAMQWSVRINEAYQRLKDPLKRAAYLCELGGAPINAENNTAMPAEFLMQQMEWREALDEAPTCDGWPRWTRCRPGSAMRRPGGAGVSAGRADVHCCFAPTSTPPVRRSRCGR
jgi:hypothetical protein